MKKLNALALCMILSMTIFGQNIQTTTYQSWTDNNWVNSMSETNSYNNGNLISTVTPMWDNTLKKWYDYSRINYTNNSDGTIQYSVSEIWNSTLGLWVNSWKTTYTYDGQKKALTIVYETWTNDTWIGAAKQINTYNSSGYLVSNLNQTWDNANSKWNDASQQIITNNGDGTIQNTITQSWNSNSKIWKNSQRIENTYTSVNKPLTTKFSSWTNGSWENSMNQIYNYDAGNNLTQLLSNIWDSNSKIWKSFSQINYTNSNTGSVQQYISQIWNSTSNSWTNAQRVSYLYAITTEFVDARSLELKVFPNPCTDKIHLSLPDNTDAKIRIFDLNGKVIYENLVKVSENDINISEIKAGFYFISLEQGGKNTIAKIVKK